MPPEILSDSLVGTMAAKHLEINEWGTSNPIYDRLLSSHTDRGITAATSVLGITSSTTGSDPKVGGRISFSGIDHRTVTTINCGESSYLERVSPQCQYCWFKGERFLSDILLGIANCGLEYSSYDRRTKNHVGFRLPSLCSGLRVFVLCPRFSTEHLAGGSHVMSRRVYV